jgi:hypothetical protein
MFVLIYSPSSFTCHPIIELYSLVTEKASHNKLPHKCLWLLESSAIKLSRLMVLYELGMAWIFILILQLYVWIPASINAFLWRILIFATWNQKGQVAKKVYCGLIFVMSHTCAGRYQHPRGTVITMTTWHHRPECHNQHHHHKKLKCHVCSSSDLKSCSQYIKH